MKNTGIFPAEILIPENTDMTKWSCVACDQFTSEKGYWDALSAFVGAEKSTLKLTLPEIYLNDGADGRIRAINEEIKKYIKGGVFRKLPKGYVLTVRSTPFVKRRIGLVAAADLDSYDYKKGVKNLIRATEGTIEERIPPRLKIRENAEIELPHIIILLYIANALLLTKGLFYQISFGCMTLSFIVAVTRILPSAYYFLLMNLAMLKGFFLAFKRERSGGWAREARSDE